MGRELNDDRGIVRIFTGADSFCGVLQRKDPLIKQLCVKKKVVEALFDTSTTYGLSTQKVTRRLRGVKVSKLKRDLPRWAYFFASQFLNFHTFLLFVFLLVSAFGCGLQVSFVLFSIAIFWVFLKAFIEFKISENLDLAGSDPDLMVKVTRDGKSAVLNSRELVCGDLVHLVSGDYVPVDLKLFESQNLSIELPDGYLDRKIDYSGEKNFGGVIFSGTRVVSGEGWGVVVSQERNLKFLCRKSFGFEKSVFMQKVSVLGRFFDKFVLGFLLLFSMIFLFSRGDFFCLPKLAAFCLGLFLIICSKNTNVLSRFLFSRFLSKLKSKTFLAESGISWIERFACLSTLLLDRENVLDCSEILFADCITIDEFGINYWESIVGNRVDTSLSEKPENSYFQMNIGKFSSKSGIGKMCSSECFEGDLRGPVNKFQGSNLRDFVKVLMASASFPDSFEKAAFRSLTDAGKKEASGFKFYHESGDVLDIGLKSKLLQTDNDLVFLYKGDFEAIINFCDNLDSKKVSMLKKWKRDSEVAGRFVVAVALKSTNRITRKLVPQGKSLKFIGLCSFHCSVGDVFRKSILKLKKMGVGVKFLSEDSVSLSKSVGVSMGLESFSSKSVSGRDLEKFFSKEESNNLSNIDLISGAEIFSGISVDQRRYFLNFLKKAGKEPCILGSNNHARDVNLLDFDCLVLPQKTLGSLSDAVDFLLFLRKGLSKIIIFDRVCLTLNSIFVVLFLALSFITQKLIILSLPVLLLYFLGQFMLGFVFKGSVKSFDRWVRRLISGS